MNDWYGEQFDRDAMGLPAFTIGHTIPKTVEEQAAFAKRFAEILDDVEAQGRAWRAAQAKRFPCKP